ncbi:MAG: hypothetical protein ABSG68_12780 [Thermoguttaceae bacterium]|jgi:hypothetical protein
MSHNFPTRRGEHSSETGRWHKRRRSVWPFAVLIPLGVLALVALALGLGLLVLIATGGRTVTPRDRRALVDAQAVAAHLDFSCDPRRETLYKKRHFNGAWELFYEYDDPAAPGVPCLRCQVFVEPSVQRAHEAFLALWGASGPGPGLFGNAQVEVLPRDDLFAWGDESRLAVVRCRGTACGNVFVTRKATRVFFLVITGAARTDRLAFADLVLPALANLESIEP